VTTLLQRRFVRFTSTLGSLSRCRRSARAGHASETGRQGARFARNSQMLRTSNRPSSNNTLSQPQAEQGSDASARFHDWSLAGVAAPGRGTEVFREPAGHPPGGHPAVRPDVALGHRRHVPRLADRLKPS
jgi:hypothetical protein